MKLRSAAFCASLSLIHAVSAQDSATPEPAAALGKKAATPDTRTFIPHALEFRSFVPPVPVARKPLPAIRTDAALSSIEKSGRKLTLLRGEASTLPDIPPPPPPVRSEYGGPTAESLARMVWYRHHNLSFGATIFDHRVSHVCWTDPESGEFYQAICGFDIGLLAGTGSFIHRGEKYSLFLAHSSISLPLAGRVARSYAARFPSLPKIAPGEVLVIRGDTSDPEAVAPIHMLGKLIDSEKERLTVYQASRREYFRQHAAWQASHPVPPRDETFLFRPHRGSRYLANSRPEGKEEAK